MEISLISIGYTYIISTARLRDKITISEAISKADPYSYHIYSLDKLAFSLKIEDFCEDLYSLLRT